MSRMLVAFSRFAHFRVYSRPNDLLLDLRPFLLREQQKPRQNSKTKESPGETLNEDCQSLLVAGRGYTRRACARNDCLASRAGDQRSMVVDCRGFHLRPMLSLLQQISCCQ